MPILRLSRTAFVLVLVATLGLTACDSGETPTAPQGPSSVEVTRPLADLHLTFPDIDPRTVRLDSVFRASTRLTYKARVEGDAVAAQVVGSALVLTPNADGSASVHLTATDLGGRSAETSFGVTIAIPSRIAAALPPQPFEVTTTPAPPFKVALRSLIHHMDGLPLVYEIDTPTPTWLNASLLQGDSLGLAPDQAGEAVVTVRVFDPDRKRSDRVDIPVHVTPHPVRTCDQSPPGTFDPLPFQTGQTVTFAYREVEYGPTGMWTAATTTRTGTLTWTIRDRKCESGIVQLTFEERQTFVETRDDATDTTHVDQTVLRNTSFARREAFPTVGCCVGMRPSASEIPELPASSYFAPFTASGVLEGRPRSSYSVSLEADAQGLTLWRARSGYTYPNAPGGSHVIEIKRL